MNSFRAAPARRHERLAWRELARRDGLFGSHSLNLAPAPEQTGAWGATISFGYAVIHRVFHGLPNRRMRLRHDAQRSLRRIWGTRDCAVWPPRLIMRAVNGELGPDFAALECPTVFVVGTGAHSGATEDEMRTVRAAVADAEESNERVSVFATTPPQAHADPQQGPDTVVAAIEGVVHG
jgi:hypothetical protein